MACPENPRDQFPAGGLRDIAEADLVVASRQNANKVESLLNNRCRVFIIGTSGSSIDEAIDQIRQDPGKVVFLASGDPGFFGITRRLSSEFGPESLTVRPSASSISSAFAHLGLAWDDAQVVSAHGRPHHYLAAIIARYPKCALLSDPALSFDVLVDQLGDLNRHVVLFERLGGPDQKITHMDLKGLGSHQERLEPCLVIFLPTSSRDSRPSLVWPPPPGQLAWGISEDKFSKTANQITKPEVRAVVLSKLSLSPTGHLWDLGAGSGSVGIEAALLCPQLTVTCVERDPDKCKNIQENAHSFGVNLTVECKEISEAISTLQDPQSVFVGGGGIDALDMVLSRFASNMPTIVATFSAIDRALSGYDRLGHVCEVSTSQARRLPDGGVRLVPNNPVFVAWNREY